MNYKFNLLQCSYEKILYVLFFIAFVSFIAFLYISNKEENRIAKEEERIITCSEQARLLLINEQNNRQSNSDIYSQTNHYNKEIGKCLINLKVLMNVDNQILIQREIREVFEGKNLITCYTESLNFCVVPAESSDSGEPEQLNIGFGEIMISDYMSN